MKVKDLPTRNGSSEHHSRRTATALPPAPRLSVLGRRHLCAFLSNQGLSPFSSIIPEVMGNVQQRKYPWRFEKPDRRVTTWLKLHSTARVFIDNPPILQFLIPRTSLLSENHSSDTSYRGILKGRTKDYTECAVSPAQDHGDGGLSSIRICRNGKVLAEHGAGLGRFALSIEWVLVCLWPSCSHRFFFIVTFFLLNL